MKDEAYYEAVAIEIQRKELKPGLWTKAVAKSGGSNDRARSLYLKLRAAQLRQADNRLRTQRIQRKTADVALAFLRTGPWYVASVALGFLALRWGVGGLSLFTQRSDPTVAVMLILGVAAGWGSCKCFLKARLKSPRRGEPDRVFVTCIEPGCKGPCSITGRVRGRTVYRCSQGHEFSV